MIREYNQLTKFRLIQKAKTKEFYINNKLNRLIAQCEKLMTFFCLTVINEKTEEVIYQNN